MIDPLFSVRAIIDRHPEDAVPLFDLVVWVGEKIKTASDRAVYDEILEILYAKTDHSADARETYKNERTEEPKLTAFTSTP